MRRAGLILVLSPLPLAGFVVAPGCSLGLDASLIGAEAGAPDGTVTDAPVLPTDGPVAKDAPGDHAVGPGVDGGACATDQDCKSTSACVTAARCDATKHVCVLDICDAGMCKSAVCDPTAQTCSVPVSVSYHAGQFTVPYGATGCNGVIPNCFAAVAPYVFVGTTNGVSVYNVSDPTSATPQQVGLTGLPFVPLRIATVGRRVYFVGSPFGIGLSQQLNVAWIDVPAGPAATTLAAMNALVMTPPFNMGGVFPTDNSDVFLVDNDSASSNSWPTALLAAPLTDMTMLAPFGAGGLATSTAVVAASGSRLVAYRWDGPTNLPAFTFITAAGTAAAQAGTEQVVRAMGNVFAQATFAQGADSSVLWMASAGQTPDGGSFTTTSARMGWLVTSATAATFDASEFVDVEVYAPPIVGEAPVAGPIAWLDAKTALVIAQVGNNAMQASVQIASRAAGAPTIVGAKRFVVGAAINRVGAQASNGLGYVIAQDPQQAQDAQIHIFNPQCN